MPWPLNNAEYGEFDQEDWAWTYTTVRDDACTDNGCCYRPCTDIEGAVPEDLVGTYYRIGPGNFERGNRRYEHALDGDGFLASFRLDGRNRTAAAEYAGRFVETEYFRNEKRRDEVLYRNVFGTQPEGGVVKNAFDLNLKNVANTNVIRWGSSNNDNDDGDKEKDGSRLFALWEAGRPYELDPDTLETLPLLTTASTTTETTQQRQQIVGPNRALGNDGCMRGVTIDESGPIDAKANFGRTFTAHPHVVDGGRTLVAFKAAQHVLEKTIRLEFVEYDGNWNEVRNVRYSLPEGASAPHDFGISDRYYVFFQNRFEIDSLSYILGMKAPTQAMQLLLDQPNILHLVPRRNQDVDAEPIKLEIPKYFAIHNVPNVEQRGNKLYIYSNGWNLNDERFFPSSQQTAPFLGAWGGRCPDFVSGIVPPALLYRTVVDLETKQIVSHEEVVKGLVMEFPMQDPDVDSRDTKDQIFMSAASTDYTSLPGTGFAKVDTRTNKAEYWWAPPKIFTGEIHPVPKATNDTGCWLLTILYDAARECATFAILDSERFEEGPVCRIHLPHPLAYSLHGYWYPSASSSSDGK